ncbi:hypothetical protein COT97_01625 [Candidatus Falkowbacteria bacterium CG10_big_fil_rev_8_21_14_0_10_39_11]|uniref:Uncharacterized protein n=1 Tax=Candidatus Falkowbacteria bacterium CG10_big_fil_rev_8_21_14_0_10_39_11 TaxID=1974565 RepID=A0A2H0V5P3_9BACT|nr:MAG: hypothetical protein COT97_01625 [Candidatus Falkowbacteria bacterium CG10_big_fil_rev_8_21_14_0_10_39_11]
MLQSNIGHPFETELALQQTMLRLMVIGFFADRLPVQVNSFMNLDKEGVTIESKTLRLGCLTTPRFEIRLTIIEPTDAKPNGSYVYRLTVNENLNKEEQNIIYKEFLPMFCQV